MQNDFVLSFCLFLLFLCWSLLLYLGEKEFGVTHVVKLWATKPRRRLLQQRLHCEYVVLWVTNQDSGLKESITNISARENPDINNH